jgi:hypothetical protein
LENPSLPLTKKIKQRKKKIIEFEKSVMVKGDILKSRESDLVALTSEELTPTVGGTVVYG